ncbi:integrase [Hyphomicrobium sp.]|uniref:integrase n=1 Tax=Hyphomicrobium sp. TaxID=82 RepID=UPI002FE1C303
MGQLRPQNRGGIWYLVRRVPKAYAHLDDRRVVKLTTGIRVVNDPRGIRATKVVAQLSESLEEDWREMAAGRDPDLHRRFERSQRMVMNRGLSYIPAENLAVGPLEEIVRRLDILVREKAGPEVASAVLGCVDEPTLMLSGLAEVYEGAQSASLASMSPNQVRRWRWCVKRAIANVVSVIGDKSVLDLTREDGIAVRRSFQKRILEGEIVINSANIEMGRFRKILRVVKMERQIDIPLSAFDDLRIDGGDKRHRPPFETDFIQSAILAEGALGGLAPEARRVVYVMADTGMRPSEIVNLLPHHIHLDAPVPYVSIRAEGRRLKTKPSERDIPLVGCALAALRLQPEGFPTYRDLSDDLSAEVNEYLQERGLRPTPEHSLYSLRHSFEDRLTALDPPDKIIGRFMGHKQLRERYGKGPTIKHLHSWIKRIAFRPPSSI